MASSNGVSITARAFRDDFEKVAPLIREEWPGVESDALTQTEGDLEKVIALVVAATEHTKTLVRRQLKELHGLSVDEGGKKPGGYEAALKEAEARAREILGKFDVKGAEAMDLVKEELVPRAESRVRENPLTALLITLGLGFIVGVLFGRR